MHAIQITEENMAKIVESNGLTEKDKASIGRYYARNQRHTWYFIRGYVTQRGKHIDWCVLPAANFEHGFEFSPEKIRTDWDQVVRKRVNA